MNVSEEEKNLLKCVVPKRSTPWLCYRRLPWTCIWQPSVCLRARVESACNKCWSLFFFSPLFFSLPPQGTSTTVSTTTTVTATTATVTTVTATTVTHTITTTTTPPFAPELRCAGDVERKKLLVSHACEEDAAVINRYAAGYAVCCALLVCVFSIVPVCLDRGAWLHSISSVCVYAFVDCYCYYAQFFYFFPSSFAWSVSSNGTPSGWSTCYQRVAVHSFAQKTRTHSYM